MQHRLTYKFISFYILSNIVDRSVSLGTGMLCGFPLIATRFTPKGLKREKLPPHKRREYVADPDPCRGTTKQVHLHVP